MALFDTFPYLEDDTLIIQKMTENDLAALEEISWNENIYRYIPPFLYQKSSKVLLTAIGHMGGRDFEKKKKIIAGVYLKSNPDHLIGLAQMFDYSKRANQITIGYMINEAYWNQGITTKMVKRMMDYLHEEQQIKSLYAYVMPENQYSGKVLQKNGFVKQTDQKEEHNWGGKERVLVDVYVYENGVN